jgi:hypothetical protein
MMPAIVVDLPPGDAASPGARALLESCSVGAQGRARCVLSADDDSQKSIAVAIVVWDGAAHVTTRIEVVIRVGASQRWLARDLSFSPADPEVERWRAAGFAIATVVGEVLWQEEGAAASPSSPRPAAGPTEAPERPRAPADRASAPETPFLWWLDGVFGAAAVGSAAALGGEVRAARRVDVERWFVAGAARCSIQIVSGIHVVRPGASAGMGVVAFQRGRLRLSFRLEPRLDLIAATGKDTATGQSGAVTRWIFGVRQAAEASWMWSDRFGFVAGAEVSEWSGPTDIQAHGSTVALIPAVDAGAQAGIRFSLE